MTKYRFQAWKASRASGRRSSTTTRRPTTPPTTSRYTGVAALAPRRPHRRQGPVDASTRSSPPPAPGYNVVVEGVDGFAATYTSVEVATLKDTLVVADRMNAAAAHARHRLDQERRRQLEAQLAAQAGLAATPASSAAASRPASPASASCRRRTKAAARAASATAGCSQLRGRQAQSMTKYRVPVPGRPSSGVQATVVDDNKTPDDATDDLTYTGVALWRLVGRIDDKDPASFNEKLATTGARLQRRGRRRRRLHRDLHERRDRDAEGHAGRRRPHERPSRSRSARPRSRTTSPAGSPTGRSSWSPATPASSAAASRPAIARISIVPATAGARSLLNDGVSAETPTPTATADPDDPPRGRLDADPAGPSHQGPAHRRVPGHGHLGRHQSGRHQPVAQVRLQGPVAVQAARQGGRQQARVVQPRPGQEGLHDPVLLPRRLQAQDLEQADPARTASRACTGSSPR